MRKGLERSSERSTRNPSNCSRDTTGQETFSVEAIWLKSEPSTKVTRPGPLNGVLVKQEKQMIEAALAESNGRISGPTGAAAKLGLPARTLDSKIKRLKINKYRFKFPPSD